MAQAAVERFGQIDVLVTAAGISHSAYVSGDHETDNETDHRRDDRGDVTGRQPSQLRPGQLAESADVNLTGTMLAVAAVGPYMIDKGKGSIITIASIAAKRPEAGPLSYAVSKAGVWMLTKSVAMNLGPHGVRVNAIGPGYINTNMTSFMRTFEDSPIWP